MAIVIIALVFIIAVKCEAALHIFAKTVLNFANSCKKLTFSNIFFKKNLAKV